MFYLLLEGEGEIERVGLSKVSRENLFFWSQLGPYGRCSEEAASGDGRASIRGRFELRMDRGVGLRESVSGATFKGI